MTTAEELSAFADLLHNTLTLNALPAERQQELTAIGILAELEESALLSIAAQAAPELQPVRLMREAAAAHPSSAVRRQAIRGLLRLAQEKHAPAIDALYRLAVEQEALVARQAILTHSWQPSSPRLRALLDWSSDPDTARPFPQGELGVLTDAYFNEASPTLQRRLLASAPHNRAENWARIIQAIQSGTSEALSELTEHYPVYTTAERQLIIDQLARLAAAGSQPARESISLLFTHHEDPQARTLALEHNYLPEDPEQRALFYFLAEAWAQYEALDFNHNLLVSAYELAGRSLRRRLIEHSRHTGQMDWLRAAGSSGEVRWIADLSDADWDVVMRRLSEGHKYAELWRLAQVAPPLWSASILDQLGQAGWAPDADEERAGYSALLDLARASLAVPLRLRPRKALHGAAGEITCLAIRPDGGELAAGSSGQPIHRWELTDGDSRPALIGPTPVTRAIAYSPEGDYLAAASGDNAIRVFRLQGGQVIKTLVGHRAMIRALAIHPDGRTLYSAGFDGSLRSYRFPYGPELGNRRPGPGEIFSMLLCAGGRYLVSAGADALLRVWSLPDFVQAREIAGHTQTITHLAAPPNGELVASAGRDGVIYVWNITTGGLVRSIQNPEPLSSLCLHPGEQVLIGGRPTGQITLWSLSTGRLIDTLTGHQQTITGLALAPNGERLYSSDSSGQLQVWDLRTFLAIRLPGETARPTALVELQDRLKDPNLASAEKKWLTFSTELARWRQRYDIELAETETIQVGEFDIELS